jgi:NADPH-dependent ferric siderophore reductase
MFNGRLRGTFLLDLEVVGARNLAPHVRSLELASSDLREFEYVPGQDVMFMLAGGLRRRYTIRRADAQAGTAEIEVELHADPGPATRWVLAAGPGARIEAIGPRGKIAISPQAGSHLFIADDSAMPAAFAMMEALPPGAPASAVLVTAHGAGSRPGPATGHALTWVERLPARLPSADAAYALGELGLVRATTQLLIAAGMPRESIATKAYWRADQANAANGEPEQ